MTNPTRRPRGQTHRRIGQQAYGPIPRDTDGNSYHRHHRDGDPANNSLDNLQAVSIREHYDIHRAQGDYPAALRLAADLGLGFNEQSELATLANAKRIAEGRHNWVNAGESQRSVQQQLIEQGRFNFDNQVAAGTHPSHIKPSCRECRAVVPLTNYRKHYSKQHGIVLPALSTGSRHSRRRALRGQGRVRNGLLPL